MESLLKDIRDAVTFLNDSTPMRGPMEESVCHKSIGTEDDSQQHAGLMKFDLPDVAKHHSVCGVLHHLVQQ